jgi:hypothetical protein
MELHKIDTSPSSLSIHICLWEKGETIRMKRQNREYNDESWVSTGHTFQTSEAMKTEYIVKIPQQDILTGFFNCFRVTCRMPTTSDISTSHKIETHLCSVWMVG